MTSRERLQATLAHEQPDRVCVDFGATAVTGMHASAVSRLRLALLGDEDYRVKVIEPYQMLGEIDAPLREALGIDIVGVLARTTLFGFENRDWKPFELFDGTPVLVPGDFKVRPDERGDLVIFPQGDTSVPPSGRMPMGGYFFDSIVRQEPIDDARLDVADNTEEFVPLGDEDVRYYAEALPAAEATNCGTVLSVPGAGFGDIALVPGPWMKHPRGIRDVAEWYMSTVTRRDYVYQVFEKQCEVALDTIERLAAMAGDKCDVAFLTGTDFGTQRGPFISPRAYRDLFKPFHVALNEAVHRQTGWKTFIHSCGSVIELIPDFIDAGFDILNPVQTSAEGMEAAGLKREYGRDLVFWGGGVDTQHTLAFGSAEEVYAEVQERIDVLGAGGGFVFNAIHNVQGNTPTENLLALFRAIAESGG